jgi:hypothetical protein
MTIQNNTATDNTTPSKNLKFHPQPNIAPTDKPGRMAEVSQPYPITCPGKVYEGRFVYPPGYGINGENADKLKGHYWHVLRQGRRPCEETYEAVMAAPTVRSMAIKKLLYKALGGRQIRWANSKEGIWIMDEDGYCIVTPGDRFVRAVKKSHP